MTPDEEWRPVVGHEEHFAISSLGRIRSLPRVVETRLGPRRYPGRILKASGQDGHYLMIRAHLHGAWVNLRPHVEVAAAFIGPRPDGFLVCHNNGERTDNRATNLRYDTPAANNADIVRHGHHVDANKTHCKWGHPFSADNTRIRPSGARTCRTCARKWSDQNNARQRAKRLANN